MRTGYSLIGLLASILATGCSASQVFGGAASQTALSSNERPSVASHPIVYASLLEGGIFYGFKLPNSTPFCGQTAITHAAIVNSIGTDKSGTLWLPTLITSGSRAGAYVFSYAPNCGTPGTTLNAPANEQPLGIAFGPDGTKYVLLRYFNSTASVAIYPPGATSPSAELTDSRLNNKYGAEGVGADARGRVYVTCCAYTRQPKRPRFAIVFKPGQGSQQRGKRILLSDIEYPGLSVTFDRSQNMLLTDLNTSSLKVYTPPYSGNPTTYALQGGGGQCALSHAQDLLACADYGNNSIDIYTYPSVTFQYSISVPSPISPRVPPGGVAFAR